MTVRPARSNQIAQEMQVEADEDQRCRGSLPSRERSRQKCNEQRKANIMPQHMMVITPPIQRPRAVPRGDLRHNSQAVQVGNNTGQCDERAVPFLQGNNIRHRPADQKMSDWAQSL